MKRLRLGALVGLLSIMLTAAPVPALAAQSSSSNYSVNEVQFGSGGLLSGSSASYSAQENVGSATTGTAASTNNNAAAGFLTPNVPFLQILLTPGNLNLGTLSPTSASTGTATFSVRAYLDSGYVVIAEGTPPKSGNAILKNLSTPTASSPGTEQFGINLVQNSTSCHSSPANFGANPSPAPDATFANGAAAANYNTCGLFTYNTGDTIAKSTSNGLGETDYTVSYLFNIGALTKAGYYTFVEDLVAVPTF